MNEKRKYFIEYCKGLAVYDCNALARRVLKKDIFHTKYEKNVYSAVDGNEIIKNYIRNGTPFAAVRLGGTEIRTIADTIYSQYKLPIFGLNQRTLQRICTLSGFFPATRENVEGFSKLYLEMLPYVDILCVWDCFMQGYFANNFAKKANLTTLYALEPYYFDLPWSSELKGKKVLVIHPFAKTIEKQFRHKEKIFENTEVLPDMQLMTLKAVQSLGGKSKFESWFEALEWMYSEAMKMEFDVALIGCGAYGLPLAIKFKKAGKQAIQIGGALQLLFGIKGKRWESKPEAARLFNENWVRPDESERPETANSVEGACYW